MCTHVGVLVAAATYGVSPELQTLWHASKAKNGITHFIGCAGVLFQDLSAHSDNFVLR